MHYYKHRPLSDFVNVVQRKGVYEIMEPQKYTYLQSSPR